MTDQKKLVVCIEDGPEMIDLVKLILQGADFEFVGAVGGREGLNTVRQLKPDLVLLDLMMPDVDGWEVHRQMKADDDLSKVPVIVVTAEPQGIDRVLGLHIAKVDDYITKPFCPQQLLDSANGVLGVDRSSSDVSARIF